MEIHGKIKIDLNEKDLTAKVAKSPMAEGDIFIPRFVVQDGKKYIIKSLCSDAFANSKITSITFPFDSEVANFESFCFNYSPLKKLQIPSKLEEVGEYFINHGCQINRIEVSPQNEIFSIIDNKLLCQKDTDGNLHSIIICCRDAERITVPASIKEIHHYAFDNCTQIKSLDFETNSLLEKVGEFSFSRLNLKKIILPRSLKYLEQYSLSDCTSLESIEFLSTNIELSSLVFYDCKNLKTIKFPNAIKINVLYDDSLKNLSDTTIFFVNQDVEIIGEGANNFIKHAQYIYKSDSNKQKNTANEDKQANKQKKTVNKESEKDEEIVLLKKRIRYLESRLSKYEQVTPFNPKVPDPDSVTNIDLETLNDDSLDNKSNDNIFIDDEDEKNFQVIKKIGEGATSIAYKIVDKRTGSILCKKMLKTEDNGDNKFYELKNNFKEFEVLHSINHPCICKAVGVDLQAKVESTDDTEKFPKEVSDDDDNDKKETITTIAVFMKYMPYSLKKCLETGQLNNTLKVKIALEIAFGMSHVHSLGMIHRDLKLENVMLDYIYEAKLIDFGLVHVDDLTGTKISLTKGVGTLAYMSPEMASEEDYDNKTDVYSYGVLLHVIFSGRLPKQSLKEKINNKEAQLSRNSASISEYCLNIIRRCMSFEPAKRPTFDEIIDDLYKNSFKLASEVDVSTVLHRYQILNRLRVLQQK